MHLTPLASSPPALRLFGPGVGTPFGSLTGGGGVARALADPVSSTASVWSDQANCAHSPYATTPGYGIVGLLLPSAAPIMGYKAWSSGSGWDQASQAATITIQLQGSHNTTTGLDGTWTTLHTASVADPWAAQDVRDVLLPSATDPYKAYRLYITGDFGSGGQAFQCNGLRFYHYEWV